jgi:hypothetical protein
MTDSFQPAQQQAFAPGAAAATGHLPAPFSSGLPMAYGPAAPIGKIRSTGLCILLAIVTFGIYQLVYFYKTHDEMKRHTGQGLGGGLALLLSFFLRIVMPFVMASEVGGLYARRGQHRPVSGATGLWYFPGAILVVGPLVWFIKTNGALNAYWRSLGAR